jgi:hypothetical protein
MHFALRTNMAQLHNARQFYCAWLFSVPEQRADAFVNFYAQIFNGMEVA